MKVTVKRANLIAAVTRVKTAIPSRAALPILTRILLQYGKDGLTLRGGDLETNIIEKCAGRGEGRGAFCVEPKSLLKYLQAIESKDVVLSSKVSKDKKFGKVTVSNGNFSLELDSLDAAEYPPLPKTGGEPVRIADLAATLAKVSYAMADDESRPVLHGVCLNPVEKRLEASATDGFRLAITKVKGGVIPEQVILPASAVEIIQRLKLGSVKFRCPLKDKTAETTAHQYSPPRFASLETNGTVLVIHVVDGNFPNYNQLVPKGGTACKFDAEEMRKALKIATSVSPDSGIIRMQTKGKKLIVSAISNEGGTLTATLSAKGKIKSAYNVRYLIGLLQRLEGEVAFQTTAGSAPLLVKQSGIIHVLMPMFVADWQEKKPANGEEKHDERTEEARPGGPDVPVRNGEPVPASV